MPGAGPRLRRQRGREPAAAVGVKASPLLPVPERRRRLASSSGSSCSEDSEPGLRQVVARADDQLTLRDPEASHRPAIPGSKSECSPVI